MTGEMMSILGNKLRGFLQPDHLTRRAAGPMETGVPILDALPMRTEHSKSYHMPPYLSSFACGIVQNRARLGAFHFPCNFPPLSYFPLAAYKVGSCPHLNPHANLTCTRREKDPLDDCSATSPISTNAQPAKKRFIG